MNRRRLVALFGAAAISATLLVAACGDSTTDGATDGPGSGPDSAEVDAAADDRTTIDAADAADAADAFDPFAFDASFYPTFPDPDGGAAMQITLGDNRSCAVLAEPGDAGGKLECWGDNTDGTLLGKPLVMPLDAVLESPRALTLLHVAEMQLGGEACARTANGNVYCWSASALPTAPIVTNAKAITTGTDHSCALLADGRVTCWSGKDNWNASPQVGVTPKPTPNLVATAVVAGEGVTCAIRASDHKVVCWGAGDDGAGGTVGCAAPCELKPLVFGADDASALHVPDHELRINRQSLCGLDSANILWCGSLYIVNPAIGLAYAGSELRDGKDGGLPLASLAQGPSTSCGIAEDPVTHARRVVCWGANPNGAAGAPPAVPVVDIRSPATIAGIASPVEVSVGDHHACARESSGVVKCWGGNDLGQLGLGAIQPDQALFTAVPVSGLAP